MKGDSGYPLGDSIHSKTVLLADDNSDDIFLMKMACDRSGFPHRLHIVTDGEMAIDYLSGNGHFSERTVYPVPSVVFLDIKMPRINGFEVLKLIRAKPELKGIPVVILSTSTLTADVDRAYQLGATSYLIKTSNQPEFERAVAAVLKCWLDPMLFPAQR